MNELLGLINITEDKPLTEISVNRPVASQPFGGKYRVIDFTLSSMVNAGISNIGLMLSEHSRSVLDHIRSGKEWGLARKQGGLYYLPPARLAIITETCALWSAATARIWW